MSDEPLFEGADETGAGGAAPPFPTPPPTLPSWGPPPPPDAYWPPPPQAAAGAWPRTGQQQGGGWPPPPAGAGGWPGAGQQQGGGWQQQGAGQQQGGGWPPPPGGYWPPPGGYWPPPGGYWSPVPAAGGRGRIRALIAVVVGAVLLAAGLVAAHAALVAQSSSNSAAIDQGIVDVTTDLGLQDASAAGTGIVLSPSGEILTNNHVIRGATSISVTIVATGRTYRASVVGYDIDADVAVLQLQGASGLPLARLGDSGALSVGDAVQAVGNVGGVGGTPTVADGTVTALGQSITATDDSTGESEELNDMIETNASVRPGDSGGPLFNAGAVVGMDTAGSATFSVSAGSTAGFAIPIDDALSVAHGIETGQQSNQVHLGPTAFLGVQVRGTSTTTNGVLVAGVVSGSPADAVGVSSGDLIISLDGSSVSTPDGLADLLVTDHPGETVVLAWTDAGGQSHSASVELATGPAA